MSETHHPEDITEQDGSLLTDLHDIQDAKEAQIEEKLILTPQEAEDYLNFMRELYRKGAESAEFRGNHEPADQKDRNLVEADGRKLLEGLRMLIEGLHGQEPKARDERDEYKLDDLEFEDMVQAFLHLYAGMASLSYRLERDNAEFQASGYQRIGTLDKEERAVVAGQLFYDFQTFNARRFGAEGVGLMGFTRTKDAEGKFVPSGTVDLDKARDDEAIAAIASEMTYKQDAGGIRMQHPAAKLSPQQAADLRRMNPAIPRDKFNKAAQNSRDAFKELG